MTKTAIFPGSFSPFTIGHQTVVDRALPLFDKIIISIGINSAKHQHFSIEERLHWIKDVYANNEKIDVIIDETSMELIQNSKIDYVHELIGSSFKITNPQATSSCGCGTSFSI